MNDLLGMNDFLWPTAQLMLIFSVHLLVASTHVTQFLLPQWLPIPLIGLDVSIMFL